MKIKGFTLIELMIVVVIIGILASIAYPSYVKQVAKGYRADGQALMMKVANLQEQYYIDNRSYAVDMKLLGFDKDPYVTNNGFYSADSSIVDGNLQISLTALGDQAKRDDACKVMGLNVNGVRTPTGCW